MEPRIEGLKRWLPSVAAAVTLAASLIVACGEGGPGGTATPAGSPSPLISPLSATPTPTPLPPLESTSYRFLYSEFGADADTIWRADPADPAARVEVAKVSHKPGWAVVPALSPDGTKIAYNAMPQEGVDGSRDGETFILELESGKTTLVARGVDIATVPRWSPDGGLLFLRRNSGEDVTVILVQLFKPEDEQEEEEGENEEPPPTRTVLRQHESDVLDYIPLGFDREEPTMYFIQVQGGTETGTYLGRYTPATGEAVATATAIAEATATATASTPAPSPTPTPTPTQGPAPSPTPALTGDVFFVLSDQTARDFALSPDASRVAFLVPGLVEGRFIARTYIAVIASHEVAPMASPAGLSTGDQVNPIWHPDGDKVTVGQLPSDSNSGRVAIVPLDGGEAAFLAPPEQGFDAPVSWSPDGNFLAVTSFQGESLGNPGPSRLVFVSMGGQRLPAPESAEIRPVGWLKAE